MPNPNIKKPKTAWAKGQSGNPKGSSSVAKMKGDIGRMTHIQVAEVGSLLLSGTLEDLQAKANDPSSSALQRWTATLVTQSMEKGDSATYERILNRIVGRVKDVIEVTGRDGAPMEVRSMAVMQAELAAIRKAAEEMGDD